MRSSMRDLRRRVISARTWSRRRFWPPESQARSNCFTIAGADAAQVHIRFEAACLSGESLKASRIAAAAGLDDSPALRIEDVVKNPKDLGRIKI